jgi:dynein heavy chain
MTLINFIFALVLIDCVCVALTSHSGLPAYPAMLALQVSQQSRAAMSLCLWVRAMDTYATVYRIVEPKRKVLVEAQVALDASNDILALKRQQLKALQDKVAALQQQLTDTQKQLAALQFQVCCSATMQAV